MSEDSVVINCKLKKRDSEQAELLVAQFGNASEAKQVRCGFKNGKFSASVEYLDLVPSAIETLHRELDLLGGENIVSEFWFEQTDDTTYYSLIDDKLKGFSSLKALQRAKKESGNRVDVNAFDFGKDKTDYTALIRLLIPAEANRTALADLFEGARGESDDSLVETFRASCEGNFKPSAKKCARWCAFDFEGKGKRWHGGFTDLIKGVVFVVVQNDYLYIGFDTSHVESLREDLTDYDKERIASARMQNTATVFEHFKGVKEVWMKFRVPAYARESGDAAEYYVKTPNEYDDPYVDERSVTSDDDWSGDC